MRILVVDDHELVRNGIRSVLSSQPTLTVCGEAVDGLEAVEKARTLQPDVVVMDISMPNMNGLEATREIKRFMPQVEVVIVSQHETSEMFRQAFKAGARGYVVKSSIATDLLTAISKVSHHETFIKGVESTTSTATLGAHEILQRSAAFERALRESEERFRSAMNNMAEGLYTVDAQGLATYINPSAEAMFGWSSGELLGKKMHDVTHYKHPDGSPFPATDCPGLEVLQKGTELREYEDVFIRKDGRFFPVVFSAAPIRANGAASGVVVCFRDDTKRRETEEALRLRAAIVDSSDDAIVSKKLDGTIASWNRGAELIFGYSAEEAVGQPISLIIPPDRRDEEATILDRIKHGEPTDHYETVRVRKDGKRVDISLTISPIRDATGRVIAASKVARDISERKHAENALSERARQQKALFDLADQLHRSTSMEEVYSGALDAIFSALQCDRAAILRSDERGVARFVSTRGLSDTYRRAIEGHPVSGPAEDALQPIYLSDIDGEKIDDSLRPILKSEGIRALAFIPLVSNGKLIGKFIAYFDSPHRFGAHEIEVDLTIARQLAFGIERRRADEELRQSEERFRAIFETTPECVKVVNCDGTLLHMNSSGLAMVEAERAEFVIGKNVYDVIAPEDRERFRAFNERICRGEEGSLAFDIVGLNGTRRHMETHAAPLRGADGNVVQLAVTRDVTERERAERALRESEERLRAAFSQTYAFMVFMSPDGTVLNANRAAVEETGRRREQVIGRKFWEPWWSPLPKEVEVVKASIQKALAGESVREECQYCLADGTVRFADRTLTPVRDEAGKVVMIVGTGLDVTEEREARAEADASAERLRLAQQVARVGSFEFNLKTGITRWTPELEAMYGLPPGGFDGTRAAWEQLVHPDDRAEVLRRVERAMREGEFEGEWRVVWPDGTVHWLLGRGSTINDEAGNAARMVGVNIDVTERKRGEERLRQLAYGLEGQVRIRTAELEQQNLWVLRQSEQLRELSNRLLQAQDDERRHIARELHDSAGQTLTALGMGVARLVQKTKRGETAKDTEEVQQLVQQLNQEIRTTSYLLHPPLLDESGLRDALVWYLQGLKGRSTLDIRLDFPEDFGRLPREMELMLFRLVQECLTNVHRHSGSKTAAIRIARRGEDISLEVRDEGKGIPQEKLAEILSHGGGVGIRGMRERVRHFRGVMEIQSDEGAGTKISIRLPGTTSSSSERRSVSQAGTVQ